MPFGQTQRGIWFLPEPDAVEKQLFAPSLHGSRAPTGAFVNRAPAAEARLNTSLRLGSATLPSRAGAKAGRARPQKRSPTTHAAVAATARLRSVARRLGAAITFGARLEVHAYAHWKAGPKT
mmetsp:Transcript_121322/g.343330  ORF Transcript_121322/g.343330 Transcript_121322/m.343330 type:complete len:122 (+) Transcript_121322:456-821(+)